MKKNDGGQAFPRLEGLFADDHNEPSYKADNADGMTIRDYFAARSMQAWTPLLGDKMGKIGSTDKKIYGIIALVAYAQADAMLAEREKE